VQKKVKIHLQFANKKSQYTIANIYQKKIVSKKSILLKKFYVKKFIGFEEQKKSSKKFQIIL
jgi:hypothetical protein